MSTLAATAIGGPQNGAETVSLNRVEGGMQLGVALHVEMSGVDQAQGETLAAQAHQLCPYSRAISGNVDVQISVDVAG